MNEDILASLETTVRLVLTDDVFIEKLADRIYAKFPSRKPRRLALSSTWKIWSLDYVCRTLNTLLVGETVTYTELTDTVMDEFPDSTPRESTVKSFLGQICMTFSKRAVTGITYRFSTTDGGRMTRQRAGMDIQPIFVIEDLRKQKQERWG